MTGTYKVQHTPPQTAHFTPFKIKIMEIRYDSLTIGKRVAKLTLSDRLGRELTTDAITDLVCLSIALGGANNFRGLATDGNVVDWEKLEECKTDLNNVLYRMRQIVNINPVDVQREIEESDKGKVKFSG